MTSYHYQHSTEQRFTTQNAKSIKARQEQPLISTEHRQQATGRDRETGNSQMLLTIPQVAQQLGICRAHVYKLINLGLPTIHLGRSVRVSMASLQSWLVTQEENL